MLNCVIRADQYINAQELLRFTFSLIKWEIVHKAKIQPGSAPGNLSIKRRIAMEGNDFESLLISAGSFCVFTFWRQRPTKDPRSVWSRNPSSLRSGTAVSIDQKNSSSIACAVFASPLVRYS